MKNSMIQKSIFLSCFVLAVIPLVRFWLSDDTESTRDEFPEKRKYPELDLEAKKYEGQKGEETSLQGIKNKSNSPNELFEKNVLYEKKSGDEFSNKLNRVAPDNHLGFEQRRQVELESRYKTLINSFTTPASGLKYQKQRPDDRYREVRTKSNVKLKKSTQGNDDYDNVMLAKQIFEKNFVEHIKVNKTTTQSPQRAPEIKPTSSSRNYNKNINFKSKVLKEKINDKNDKDNENAFAGAESLPDYDLPMLPKKNPKDASSTLKENIIENVGNIASIDVSQSSIETSDEQMLDVVLSGTLNTSRSYAVFSTTTENREALSFVFLLPLTVLAWRRVGFDSVVIIVGSRDEWTYDPLYGYVMKMCQKLGAILIFLEPRPEKSIMISQVSRIFAANILHAAFKNQPGVDDVYLITSDADIWPLTDSAYQLSSRYDILSLNSDCCAPFSHRDVKYRMLPMANIGAKIRVWRKLTESFGSRPKNIDDILSMFVREFGPMALRPVGKGENVGWFLDQMMISMLIDKYDKSGKGKVRFVPRDTGVDRIDRNSWTLGGGVESMIDSHLLLETFTPGVWVRVTQLIKSMYGVASPEYDLCADYYEQFQELFIAKFHSGH